MTSNTTNPYNEQLLAAAAENDKQTMAELLLLCDPLFKDSWPLILAADFGLTDVVEKLIPVSNPKANGSAALAAAARNGHVECLKLLLPVSNPDDGGSFALRTAAANGQAESVKLLLGHSDVFAFECAALACAVRYNHSECIDVLYPISDPKQALATLIKYLKPQDAQHWVQRFAEVEAQQQRTRIAREVPASGKEPVRLKL